MFQNYLEMRIENLYLYYSDRTTVLILDVILTTRGTTDKVLSNNQFWSLLEVESSVQAILRI